MKTGERSKLKVSFLDRASVCHQKFMQTKDKRFWQKMLNNQWLASCVDDIDDSFFVQRKEKSKVELAQAIEGQERELEYQRGLVLRIDEAIRNGNELAVGWCEGAMEMSKERLNEHRRKIKQFSTVETRGEVEKARQYPITDLLQFKNGFANCIFHNEKTASLKYYPKTNTFHCFGCHKTGDSITVAQQLWGCSFLEAVDKLSY